MKRYIKSSSKPQFVCFDEYVNITFGIWRIVFLPGASIDNWQYHASCFCPGYWKNNVYKHVIVIASRINLLKIPMEAKLVDIGKKRAPGRPSKAKKALELQDKV